ncbi:MAG: hypothetical protein ACI8RE_003314, partial [Ilumatobacter sp.]
RITAEQAGPGERLNWGRSSCCDKTDRNIFETPERVSSVVALTRLGAQ